MKSQVITQKLKPVHFKIQSVIIRCCVGLCNYVYFIQLVNVV